MGAWYSDGKFQSSVASYNVPRSYRDVGGHRHDAGAARGGTRQQQYDNDLEFAKHMWASDSWIDRRMGDAVYYLGDWFHTQYTDERPVKRLRGGHDSEDEADDDEQSPLRNWQEEAEVARVWGRQFQEDMGDEGPERGTQGEVGLIPFKKSAYIQPTYTTASFKWISHTVGRNDVELWETASPAIKDSNIAMKKIQFRVNSPLDPNYKNNNNTDINNASCNGWNEYRNRYKWYRLIKNKVRVTVQLVDAQIWTASVNPNQPTLEIAQAKRAEIEARSKYPWAVGIALNPGNRYPYGSANVSEWQQLAQAKFTEWKFMNVGQRDGFYFEYEPGKWDAIVAEQQKETFWTRTNEAPPLFETFMIFLKPTDPSATAQWQVTVQMDFTCQFREWTDKVVARMLFIDGKAEDYTEADTGIPAGTSDYYPTFS